MSPLDYSFSIHSLLFVPYLLHPNLFIRSMWSRCGANQELGLSISHNASDLAISFVFLLQMHWSSPILSVIIAKLVASTVK